VNAQALGRQLLRGGLTGFARVTVRVAGLAEAQQLKRQHARNLFAEHSVLT